MAFLIISSLTLVLLTSLSSSSALPQNGGKWKVLRRNIGISAMHVALLPNDKLIVFDRTDFGLSNISLPAGRCRDDVNEQALKHDCSAHSIEFNPKTRSVRPLTVLTDTWCSSGSLSADGVLIQTGGFNDGDHAVRFFSPCDTCDWEEINDGLIFRRWYASNALLPDGRIIVLGGRARFDYEFIPKLSVYELPFLRRTKDSSENNLYPFVHLLPDGNLFVFANTKSILLDFKTNRVVREFPEMPGYAARNYPSSGSSVLLPLWLNNTNNGIRAEIMVCGGAEASSNSKAMKGEFLPADDTCGRLIVTKESPEWEMERMPMKRVMGDMVLLPTGDLLIVNGAGKGTAGWCMGREPVLHPVLYLTEKKTFEVMDPTTIPRLYHSTAHLLSDGRVMVGGSNPNIRYEFSGVLFPTELSLEAYSPPYLFRGGRPRIVMVEPGFELRHGQRFTLGFRVAKQEGGRGDEVKVTMVVPGFTTHSFTMNQRVLVLEVVVVNKVSGESYVVDGFVPAAPAVAPPGYYLLHVVHGGVPSRGKWVKIK